MSLGGNDMKCEYCDNAVPMGATRCPSCGAMVSAEAYSNEKTVAKGGGGLNKGYSAETGWVKMQSDNVVRDPRLEGLDDSIRRFRWVYVLLAIFLGMMGIHNFYAGYVKRGVAQMILSILGVFCFGYLISFLWSLVEAIAVRRDADGHALL